MWSYGVWAEKEWRSVTIGYICCSICVHSARLVAIAKWLGESPFFWFIAFCALPSACLCSGPLGGIALLGETVRRSADCSFHRLFDPSPSGLRVLEQRAECVPSANRQVCLAMLRLQLLRSFQPFCSFLRLSVHASTKTSNTWNLRVFIRYWDKISIRGHYFYQNKALNESNLWTHQHPQLKLLLVLKQTQVQPFKKGVSNSATQDSIMNAHNKTQFTYARINCVLKDSSCDTPLPKILMLAILATCASSSSTKSI